ncbi:type I polyketide synthase [Streptomyces sp. NPDC050355]|uniref:type I polyketide synthase n=1 Tax=Streptomyces sp. NPDC050355 TaxID=3365609 RepID=UPI0037A9B70D
MIGAACRLPGGVGSAQALWDLLLTGGDVVGEVPRGRWDPAELAAVEEESGRPLEWAGGFLSEDFAAFDAEFFGVSEREATLIDPQHRLLMEVAWEACEHAGLPTASVNGTRTGTFVGFCNPDHWAYSHWLPCGGGAYAVTGNQYGGAAGRISHLLGLRGPSIALDTGCSSGLVAAHAACQSLQTGECDLALAGAANLLLSPRTVAAYSELGVLSPTGRCRSFDEAADGYVRAEGCVVLVLKRHRDAVREGDRIMAVLAGTAVNHDGRTSRFTLPSRTAQQDVCRAALSRAGVDPAAVGMLEAHGSGTRAGDRIEFASLAAVYGQGRGRCALGSAKSNVGHTESAAGMVGLLKAVLAVQHGEVPASLHFRNWQSGIDPAGTRLYVPTVTERWPVGGMPRLAAVCSYGAGGTNAHAIVAQAPATGHRESDAPQCTDAVRVFLLSSGSVTALGTVADRLVGWLTGPGAGSPLADVAHTLALRRSHADERLAVVARTRGELVSRLRSFAETGAGRGMAVGFARGAESRRSVWVFSGHGSQWPGMGRELIGYDPVFTATVAELDPLIAGESGFSVGELLRAGAEATRFDQVQPLVFTVQLALARTLRAHGVEPAAVVGHSMGEVAAAVVAGALSPEDGVRVICRRSALCLPQGVSRAGAMAAVDLGHERVSRAVSETAAQVDVAVIAAPRSTVIGGVAADVRRMVEDWNTRGIPARMIAVDVASHSRLVRPVAEELERALADLRPRKPDVPFYSTVLADPREKPAFDAAYWAANLSHPVRAMAATAALIEDGYLLHQEVSPHPVAARPLTDTFEALGATEAVALPSLRSGEDSRERLWSTLAALHCHGHPVPWRRWYGNGALTDVPTTAWDRRHLLIDLGTARSTAVGATGSQFDSKALESRAEADQPADEGADPFAALRAASDKARPAVVEELVTDRLRVLLRLRNRRIHSATGFADLGLDSLLATRLRVDLERSLGIAVPLSLIWKHPTVRDLSARLCKELAPGRCEADTAPPATGTTGAIDLAGGALHYRVWGTGHPDSPPVVLLHANAASAASWQRVAAALTDRFRVYALDLRGHGSSFRPAPALGAYGLRAVADDVLAFLEAMGLHRPLLIGHSWGAAVALVLAAGAETGLPCPALWGLVLEDPPTELSPAATGRHLRDLLRATGLSVDVLRETIAVAHPNWDETDVASLAEGLSQADPAVVRGLMADGARSGPLMPLLARLGVPVLLLRADPRCGGLLADEDWKAARRSLPPGSIALDLPGVPHEVHRAELDRFVAALRTFTTSLMQRRESAPAPTESGAVHACPAPERPPHRPADPAEH